MPWNETPRRSASPRAAAHADLLRKAMTEPEKRLWWHLRHRLPVNGSHFRRQVALGPYVADFCCLAGRLVIEVDGDQHGHAAQATYDTRRSTALEAQGFRVLRFTNTEVMREITFVLDTIFAHLRAPSIANPAAPPPPPAPPHKGEGSRRP